MLDASEVVVGSSGHLWVGDTDAEAPTNATDAPGEDWAEMGYVSEDGVQVTPGQDITDIRAWQSKYPIRRIVTGSTLEFALQLLQWNSDTVPFAFGGGEWTDEGGGDATYTPPGAEEINEKAIILDWADGDKSYRLYVKRTIVSGLGQFTLKRDEAAALEITVALLGAATEEDEPFELFANDPSLTSP